jgi:hypothetical protein
MSDILRVLIYFDLFDHPLTERELRCFTPGHPTDQDWADTLTRLLRRHIIFRINGFYSLRNEPPLCERRLAKNRQAELLLRTATETSGLLYRFPFVRGILISGSLSKHVAEEDGDIDYFIITAPGRLWIARSLLHLFKKITFLKARQHWYCMNYFIDERALEIQEKNFYTAMELVTLLPFHGDGVLESFREANRWAWSYFPSADWPSPVPRCRLIRSPLKIMMERVLECLLPDRLDDWLMNVTSRRWARKEKRGDRNIKGQRMGVKTAKHFCKPNPVFFQDALLATYEREVSSSLDRFGLD